MEERNPTTSRISEASILTHQQQQKRNDGCDKANDNDVCLLNYPKYKSANYIFNELFRKRLKMNPRREMICESQSKSRYLKHIATCAVQDTAMCVQQKSTFEMCTTSTMASTHLLQRHTQNVYSMTVNIE